MKELLLQRERKLEQLRYNIRRCRENKKRKKSIRKPQLRPKRRIANVCNLISNKLEDLVPLSTEDRILKANEMF